MPRGVRNITPVPDGESLSPEPVPSNDFPLDAEDLATARDLRAKYEAGVETYHRRKEEDPKLKIKPPKEFDVSAAFQRAAFLKSKKLGFSGATNLRKTDDGWVATGIK